MSKEFLAENSLNTETLKSPRLKPVSTEMTEVSSDWMPTWRFVLTEILFWFWLSVIIKFLLSFISSSDTAMVVIIMLPFIFELYSLSLYDTFVDILDLTNEQPPFFKNEVVLQFSIAPWFSPTNPPPPSCPSTVPFEQEFFIILVFTPTRPPVLFLSFETFDIAIQSSISPEL